MNIHPSSREVSLSFFGIAVCFVLLPATLTFLVLDAIGVSFKQTRTSFNKRVDVVTIPSKKERNVQNLWYKEDDYNRFKDSLKTKSR